MPDIANEKRPREDDDSASHSNPKRLREDLMHAPSHSKNKRPLEEPGDSDQAHIHVQVQAVHQGEASAIDRTSPKRRRSCSEEAAAGGGSRASTPAPDGDESVDTIVLGPSRVDEASDDELSSTATASTSTAALVLADPEAREQESDTESMIVIDLTSQEQASSSRSRRHGHYHQHHHYDGRRMPRFDPSRGDNYPPRDSFPRVPYMEEQRGFQLPSMRSYMREYSRQSSLHSQSSSVHVEVSDGEGNSDHSDDADVEEDYHDPHHPWSQGPVQLIMNEHGVPRTPSVGLTRTSSRSASSAFSREPFAIADTNARCMIEPRSPPRPTGTTASSHQSHSQRDAGVSLAAAAVFTHRRRPAEHHVIDDTDTVEPHQRVDNGQEEGNEREGEQAGSSNADDASIVAQGGDRRDPAIVISDDEGTDEDDDSLSMQAQHSDNRRSSSPIFLHASRSPSPVRVDDTPRTSVVTRTFVRHTISSSPPSHIADEIVSSRHSHREGQLQLQPPQQRAVGPHQHQSSSLSSHHASEPRSFHVPPVPLILRREPSAFTNYTRNGSPSRHHSFMSEGVSHSRSVPPSRHMPYHVPQVGRERSSLPAGATPMAGALSAERSDNGHAYDSQFTSFREQVLGSPRSSVTATPTATQQTSGTPTPSPNTTQESMFTALGSPTPTPGSSPSPTTTEVVVPIRLIASPSLTEQQEQGESENQVHQEPQERADQTQHHHQQRLEQPVIVGIDRFGTPAVSSSSSTATSTNNNTPSANNTRTFIARLRCQICWETPSVPTATQCGHVYCEDCIQQWLATHRQCPVCRSTATSHSLQEMEFFVSTKSS